MTPTTYKFRVPQDLNFDHYVAYAAENTEQLFFGELNVCAFSNFYSFIQNQHNTISTLTPLIILLLLLSVEKLNHQTNQLFPQQNIHKILFSKSTILLHLSRTILTTP